MASYNLEDLQTKVLGSTFTYTEFNIILEALKKMDRRINTGSDLEAGVSNKTEIRFLTTDSNANNGSGFTESTPINIAMTGDINHQSLTLPENGNMLIIRLDASSSDSYQIGSIIDKISGWDSILIAPYIKGTDGIATTKVNANITCAPASRSLRLEGMNISGGYINLGVGFDLTYNEIDLTFNNVRLNSSNKIYVPDGFRASVFFTEHCSIDVPYNNLIDEMFVSSSAGMVDLYTAINARIATSDYSGHYILKQLDNRKVRHKKAVANLEALDYQTKTLDSTEVVHSVGGIKKGSRIGNLKGLSVSDIVDLMLLSNGDVDSTKPKLIISGMPEGLYYPNSTFTVYTLVGFDTGNVDNDNDGNYDDGQVAGNATNAVMSGAFDSTVSMSNNSGILSGTYDVNKLGAQPLKIEVFYTEGPSTKDGNGNTVTNTITSTGETLPNPYPAGTLSKSTIVDITLPIYATKNNILNFEELDKVSLSSESIIIPLAEEAFGNKQKFRVPVVEGLGVTNILTYNPMSGKYTEEGGYGHGMDYWTRKKINSPNSYNYEYDEYTYTGAHRGAINVKIMI